MTKFTDDKGAEFEELVGDVHIGKDEKAIVRVIRPIVKAEPKYAIILDGFGTLWNIDIVLNLPEDQAQLIKEAVEALMSFICDDIEYDLVRFVGLANKARQSLKEEQ